MISTDYTFVFAGQSNAARHFNSYDIGLTGAEQFEETINALTGVSSTNATINTASGGSAVLRNAQDDLTDTNYWWDLDANQPGPLLLDAIASIQAAGGSVTGIIWAQGEQDAQSIGGTTPVQVTIEDYIEATKAVFDYFRTELGDPDLPIFIQQLSTTDLPSAEDEFPLVRAAQTDIADEMEGVYIAAPTYDVPLVDNFHFASDANPTDGYRTVAERLAHFAVETLGGGTEPSFVSPTLLSATTASTTQIIVTIEHDGSTDFSPQNGIEGFAVEDFAGSVEILSAARISATEIQIDLGRDLVGNITVSYLETSDDFDPANIVSGNSPLTLPLQPGSVAITSPFTVIAEGDEGNNDMRGIESAFADFIQGNGGDDTISGGGGDDVLSGDNNGAGVGTGNGYPEQVLNHEPLGFLRLGETTGTVAADETGNLTATYHNVNAANNLGVNQGPLSEPTLVPYLDGHDDYIQIDHDPSLILPNGTVQLWFRSEGLMSEDQTLISITQGGNQAGSFYLALNKDDPDPRDIEMRFQDGTNDFFLGIDDWLINPAGTVTPDTWQHIAVSWGTEGVKLYLDGQLAATMDYFGGVGIAGVPVHIGASARDGFLDRFYQANISEVAFFGDALQQGDIEALYLAGINGASGLVPGNDSLLGGLGDDAISGGGGDDTIDGGDDNDTAVFSDNFADYDTTVAANGSLVVTHLNNGLDGVDTLTNVELLQFADQLVSVADLGLNLAPVAQNDSATTGEDSSTTIAVLDNDSDGDGDTLTVEAVDTSGTQGSVVINADNTVSYDPGAAFQSLNAGQTAVDSFTYTISDGKGATDTASVSVTITGADDGSGGGSGSNVISGTENADTLTGSFAPDSISGLGGNDLIEGADISSSSGVPLPNTTDDDTILGGDGFDTINGGEGSDLVFGGDGFDFLKGAAGDDDLQGNINGDTVAGGQGNDIVRGGRGLDNLRGSRGDDTVVGGRGADTLNGGTGDDVLTGREGADAFYFDQQASGFFSGIDVITDFALGEDQVLVAGIVNGIVIASVDELLGRISDDASGNAVIDLGIGQSVTLLGVNAIDLSEDDFAIL